MTLRLGVAALATMLLLVPTVLAADGSPLLAPRALLDAPMTAHAGTYTSPCQRAYRPNRPGVATRTVTAPAPGTVTVELAGTDGDWDVAVFDADGRAVAADASPDAQEIATGYTAGGPLNVQACRRSGNAAAIPTSLRFQQVRRAALDEEKANPPQLVSVITPNDRRKQELTRLGLDMTEHGGKESLGVVLHGTEDEQGLRKGDYRVQIRVSRAGSRATTSTLTARKL